MKKIFVSTLLLIMIAFSANARKVTICLDAVVISACFDVEVSCGVHMSGRPYCTFGLRVNGKDANYDAKNAKLTFTAPMPENKNEYVDRITIKKDVLLLNKTKSATSVFIKAGTYKSTKDGKIVLTTYTKTIKQPSGK